MIFPFLEKEYPTTFKFKEPYPSWFGNLSGKPHLGVDILCPEGTPIKAWTGMVVHYKEGNTGGAMAYCYPDEEGRVVRFLHNSIVYPGYHRKGEIIALSGNTGVSTDPHTHVDVSKGAVNIYDINNFINPEEYFKMKQVYLRIKVSNHTTYTADKAASHLVWEKQNLEDKGIILIETDVNPDIILDVWSSEYSGGNCSKVKPYVINWHVGKYDAGDRWGDGRLVTVGPSWGVLIHEITHALWNEANLGGMHTAPDADPYADELIATKGNAALNDYAIAKFFENYIPNLHFSPNTGPLYGEIKEDMLTETQVRVLNALCGVDKDPEAERFWAGKPLSEWLYQRLIDEDAEINQLIQTLTKDGRID